MDRLAARERVSRNRLILRACEEYLERQGGTWPAGFFEPASEDPDDIEELRAATEELEVAIQAGRRNRGRLDL